MTIAWESI